MNNVQLIGFLTRDPESKQTSTGKTFCEFSLAVNKRNGTEQTVSYFTIKAWERQAEIVMKYCRKGNKIGVVGELTQQRWTDKDNKQQSKISITMHQLDFLSSPEKNQNVKEESQGKTASSNSNDYIPPTEYTEDLF